MRPIRYAVRALVLLLFSALPAVVITPPAHAAATPWAFSQVSYAEVNLGPFGIAEVVAKCPVGFVALGGGWGTFAPSEKLEPVAAYRAVRDGQSAWVAVMHNFFDATYKIHSHAVCANAGQVGTIQTVSANLGRNGATGIAGGSVNCPGGQRAIGGGADWNVVHDSRRIDVSAPTTSGQGWMVSGFTGVSDTLHVEAYCVSAADLGVSAPVVTTHDVGGETTFNLTRVCPAGQRAVTGGVMTGPPGGSPDPTAYRAVMENGHTVIPSDNDSYIRWRSVGRVLAGTRLTHSVWCLPSSHPSVNITSQPPLFTNSTSATFNVTSTEPSGEGMNVGCRVGQDFVNCGSGTAQVTGLTEGPHTFTISAQNYSWGRDSDSYSWTVDLTPPTVVPPSATVPLNGPVTIGFSEPALGVTGSSLQVKVAGTSTALPGTVLLAPGGLQATWTPSAALVPGETYVVSTTTAIKDRAGNSLPADTHLVKASGVVESSSALLRQTWDLDNASAALGGKYADSRTKDSAATWRFSASAGQRATVFGVRRPNGGYAAVYVDGVKKATASFYRSATRHQVPVFTSAALSSGQHTVEVRVLGTKPSASAGTWVSLDALGVGGTRRQESAATQRFQRVLTASASGGSFDSVMHATNGDNGTRPAYSLAFKGTGVGILATRGPSSGTARIYIDGVLKRTVNLRSATTSYQVLAASITGLSETRHTLRIEPVGTASGSGSAVGIDRVDILNP